MVFGLKIGLPSKKHPAEPPPKNGPQEGQKASMGGGTGKSALTVNEFVARSKRQKEKGLEPTRPELIAYARYLGIDPISDGDLMWIAEECLNSPLPSEWTEHHDSAERVFYYNVQTHSSSWTHPLETVHRETYKRIVAFRNGDMTKEEQVVELEKLRKQCDAAEYEAHKELQAWTEHIDDQGQKFFFNREHQRSVWTDPRPAKCHDLYLQMKAIRVMSKACGVSVGRGVDDVMRPNLGSLDRMGPGDRLPGEKSHHKSKHDRHGGSPSGAEDSGFDSHEKERKRKKKRKDKEKEKERKGSMSLDDDDDDDDDGGLLSPEMPGMHGGDSGGGGGRLGSLPIGFGKANVSPLDFKRPGTSVVEEVRQALGVANTGSSLPPMPSGRGFRAHLGTPPGDGLAGAGHTKVRAGIKLEPLK